MSELVIHFAVYDPNEGRILSILPQSLGASGGAGANRMKVVCDSNIPLPTPADSYGISVDPRAVSCPACKETDIYKREAALYENPQPSLPSMPETTQSPSS